MLVLPREQNIRTGILFLGFYVAKNMSFFLNCIWVTAINVHISGDLYPTPLPVLIKE